MLKFSISTSNLPETSEPIYDNIKAQGEKQLEEFKAMRVPDTKPSLPLNAYTDRYSDPFYGSVEIVEAEGKLKFILNKDVTGELSHWQFDTFISTWNNKWYRRV
jgi:hypothetical protein